MAEDEETGTEIGEKKVKQDGRAGKAMREKPKCPYCGAELDVTHAFVNDATAAHKLVYTCFCRECGVYTPKRSTPEAALSAALHRAELKKDEKEKA